jgi:hypothetical protein
MQNRQVQTLNNHSGQRHTRLGCSQQLDEGVVGRHWHHHLHSWRAQKMLTDGFSISSGILEAYLGSH